MGEQCLEAEPVMKVLLACNLALDAQQRLRAVPSACMRRWSSRNRRCASASAAVLSLALAGAVFGTWPCRTEAAGELSTDSGQVIGAPFDGLLAQTARHAQPSPGRGRCGAVRFAWAKTVEAQRGLRLCLGENVELEKPTGRHSDFTPSRGRSC